MRNKAGELLCLAVIIFSLQTIVGCRKSVTSMEMRPMLLSAPIPNNLIVNGNWTTVAAEKGIIVKNGNDFTISGDATGSFYIYQRVNVDQGKFYKATVTTSYTINNYFSAGLYIMDSTLQNVLGKFERTYSSATSETWEVVFYSKDPAQVAVVLGFMEGINADVSFGEVGLVEYDYQPAIAGSNFAMYLNGKFPLVFSADQFDSTVIRISDYVNSVLLCRYEYYSDTVELPVLDGFIGSDTNYAYFNEYRHNLNSIQVGYCQKSSLTLSEILTNEFNIPTRQIHMVFGGIGEHQFTEYWNPFAGKWIAVDPCFNTRYVKGGQLAGVEDFDRSEASNYMVTFGVHFYYPSTDYLTWFWQNMDNLMITDYYTISYPFTTQP